MINEPYKGVPRKKIPWYPTIDQEDDITCEKCVNFCGLGVYQIVDDHEKRSDCGPIHNFYTQSVKKPESYVNIDQLQYSVFL